MVCQQAIFIVNSGSSSIKFAVYRKDNSNLTLYIEGHVENIGSNAFLVCKDKESHILIEDDLKDKNNHGDILEFVINWIEDYLGDLKIEAVGHRVVHGGRKFKKPVLIDESVIEKLEELIPFAPLHQPHNVEAIKIIAKKFPHYVQVACFDTSFHTSNSSIARSFALPKDYYNKGVHRYGFHGLSYEYISRKLEEILPLEKVNGKVIVAHLGNGASLCALKECKSVDSTMGFTALDGLVMGSRCGSIDPGALLYLMEEEKLSCEQIKDLLYKDSGLLGLSGISNDLRDLLDSEEEDAKQAVDLFLYYIIKHMGSLVSVLQGLEVLVFTGGIGENSDFIRKKVCDNFNWLGVEIDDELNKREEVIISSESSKVKVMVINTNEELVIAEYVAGFLN